MPSTLPIITAIELNVSISRVTAIEIGIPTFTKTFRYLIGSFIFFNLKFFKQNINNVSPIKDLTKTLAIASPEIPKLQPNTKNTFNRIFKNIPIIAIKFGKNTIS